MNLQNEVNQRLTCSWSDRFKWPKLTALLRYGNSLIHVDSKAEAKLRRKIDFRIIPIVSLLYLFCFIDRANIGK
jgi:hypothetical protein